MLYTCAIYTVFLFWIVPALTLVKFDGIADFGKKLRREERTQISPLSQSWYKQKQQQLSKRQRVVLSELWPYYGITLKYGCVLNRTSVFPEVKDHDKVVLDVGFGNGDSTIAMALRGDYDHPSKNFVLGCEIHKAGLANALSKLQEASLQNVKLVRSEIFSLISLYLQPDMLDKVCIYFPDPWPNTERDGRRRVVRQETLVYLSKVLRLGGQLHIATDAENYYEHSRNCIKEFNHMSYNGRRWELVHDICRENAEQDRSLLCRPITHYEKKAYAEGRAVHDLVYTLQEQ